MRGGGWSGGVSRIGERNAETGRMSPRLCAVGVLALVVVALGVWYAIAQSSDGTGKAPPAWTQPLQPAADQTEAARKAQVEPVVEVDLGGGVTAPAVKLSLEPMELGPCEEPPFSGQPSWIERMIHLRDEHGPFRLAYLEAILRAADMRASKKAKEQAAAGGPWEVGHAD